MSCPYGYYKSEETFYPKLYCNIDEKMCIYTKRCQQVEKYIPLDSQKECYKYIMELKKDIPKGSYFVETYRPDKKGFLYIYVEIDGYTQKILTDIKELNQNYVYIKKEMGEYKISLTPFKEKRTYNRKK